MMYRVVMAALCLETEVFDTACALMPITSREVPRVNCQTKLFLREARSVVANVRASVENNPDNSGFWRLAKKIQTKLWSNFLKKEVCYV